MKPHAVALRQRAARDYAGERSRPAATSAAVRRRMQSTGQRDTSAELRIRKVLHAMGLRYSIDRKPLMDLPRRADILFRRAKVAVFVDGCFWHGCPKHASWPATNSAFWRSKIIANRERDCDTNARLRARGWSVIRVWEHEDSEKAARRIACQVRLRLNPYSSRSTAAP